MRDPHKGTANMTGRRPSATSPGAGLRPSRHSRLQRPATQAARLGAGPALGLEQTRPRSPSRPGKAPPGGAQTLHLRATRPIEQSRCPEPAAGPTGFPCGGARPWGGAPAAPPTGQRTRRDLLSPTRLQTCRGAALLPPWFLGWGRLTGSRLLLLPCEVIWATLVYLRPLIVLIIMVIGLGTWGGAHSEDRDCPAGHR